MPPRWLLSYNLTCDGTREQAAQQARRDWRYALYQEVQALSRQGLGILPIAKHLELKRSTVRKFIRAENYPELASHQRQATILAPYEAYDATPPRAAGIDNAQEVLAVSVEASDVRLIRVTS